MRFYRAAHPQKILHVVVNDVIQVEELSRNLVVFEVIRLGSSTSGKTRPVKVTTSSSIYAHQILRRRSALKESEKFSSVFIAPDRTFEERQERRELVTELKRRVSDDSSRRHFIRRGEVCSSAKD